MLILTPTFGMPYRRGMAIRIHVIRPLISLATAVTLATLSVFAETPDREAERPFHTLLLTNGELLSGYVHRERDTIVVTTDRGAELKMPDRSILHFGRDAKDAFRFLSRAADLTAFNEVIELSEWALRQGLFGECEIEVRRASRLDLTHAKVASMEERLRQARRGPHVETEVVQAVHSAPRADPIPRRRVTDLSNEERLLLASFTRQLQPLLANRCATAGCHGRSTESDYALRLPLRGHGFTGAQSIANLKATLEFIDRDNLSASQILQSLRNNPAHEKLLAISSKAHSPLEQVERWLTSTSSPSSAATGEKRPVGDGPSPTTVQAAATSMNEATTPEVMTESSRPSIAESQAATSTTEQVESVTTTAGTTDPYDPEAFNRASD